MTQCSPMHKKFIVESSDVLEDCKIRIREEGSDTVIWYKDRYLSDHEIVDNIMENRSSRLCWTIHRPKRGWYIRVRAPSFPPDAYISLSPVESASPFYAEAALMFSFLNKSSKSGGARYQRIGEAHSYPPSTATKESSEPNEGYLGSGSNIAASFVLSPNLVPHSTEPKPTTFLRRALDMFKGQKPPYSSSFTLACLEMDRSRLQRSDAAQFTVQGTYQDTTTIPLLTYHDQTPLLTFRSTVGLLQLDNSLECQLGIDISFWIAVALAYLDYLGDREGYVAAVDS